MQREEFRRIVGEYLLPMFSGARLAGASVRSSPQDQLVAFEDPCDLLLKPDREAPFRLRLRRRQPFDAAERGLVELFVAGLADVARAHAENYFRELVASLPRRVVAQQVGGEALRDILTAVLDRFAVWSSETYEGQQITAAIGVVPQQGKDGFPVSDVWREEFAKVLTNGVDTLLVCDPMGRVLDLAALNPAAPSAFAPYRLQAIAAWAREGKVAVALNKSGEILVFKDQKLQFARRHGQWSYLSHDSVIRRLGPSGSLLLRQAVYESALDVSFARTGGCIAILGSNGARQVDDLVDHADLFATAESPKAIFLRSIINRPFQELDRRVRQELMAVDGAVVLDARGNVLTAGAIVRVPGGSTGGGRTAAAKALSRLGVAIKISTDGGVTGFRGKRDVFSM